MKRKWSNSEIGASGTVWGFFLVYFFYFFLCFLFYFFSVLFFETQFFMFRAQPFSWRFNVGVSSSVSDFASLLLSHCTFATAPWPFPSMQPLVPVNINPSGRF
jgi:hypothetical protein